MKYVDSLKRYLGHSDKTSKILDLGDYYGATDSQVLFMLPKSYFPEGINPDEISVNPPDTSFIFNTTKREAPCEFKFKDLINTLNDVPKVQEYEECNECDGFGTTECHCCGSEIECRDCNGSGDGDPIPNQYTLDSKYALSIDESYFSPSNMDKIISFLIDLNIEPEETIKMTTSISLRPHIFEVKDVIMVSMPSNDEYIDMDLVVKIC